MTNSTEVQTELSRENENIISDLLEPRIIIESGLELQIANFVEPLLNSINYRLVRVKLNNANGKTLQIMAEDPTGSLNIQDCEKINNLLSPALDIENIISEKYNLEISSPGMDRPLVRKTDFSKHTCHLAKIELATPIDGKKYFTASINSVNDNAIELSYEQTQITVNFADIKKAKLILTDELIRSVLSNDNKHKKRK